MGSTRPRSGPGRRPRRAWRRSGTRVRADLLGDILQVGLVVPGEESREIPARWAPRPSPSGRRSAGRGPAGSSRRSPPRRETGQPDIAEAIAMAIAPPHPARLVTAPAGTWTWTSIEPRVAGMASSPACDVAYVIAARADSSITSPSWPVRNNPYPAANRQRALAQNDGMPGRRRTAETDEHDVAAGRVWYRIAGADRPPRPGFAKHARGEPRAAEQVADNLGRDDGRERDWPAAIRRASLRPRRRPGVRSTGRRSRRDVAHARQDGLIGEGGKTVSCRRLELLGLAGDEVQLGDRGLLAYRCSRRTRRPPSMKQGGGNVLDHVRP